MFGLFLNRAQVKNMICALKYNSKIISFPWFINISSAMGAIIENCKNPQIINGQELKFQSESASKEQTRLKDLVIEINILKKEQSKYQSELEENENEMRLNSSFRMETFLKEQQVSLETKLN